MSRSCTSRTRVSRVIVMTTIGVAVGCGMRGPPLAPLVFVPGAVTSLQVQRFDDDVFIRFEVPTENTDGSEPANLERVEVYALTTQRDPEQPGPRLPLADWRDYATLVATIPVDGVAPDTPPDQEAASEDATSVYQGDEVTLVERLTPDVRRPVTVELETVDAEEPELEQLDEVVRAAPFLPAAVLPPPRRTYLAIGVSLGGRDSAASSRVDLTLAEGAGAPDAPIVTYTETEMLLEWTAPSTARLPIQGPVTDAALPSEPVVEFPRATRYLVFAVEPVVDVVGEDAVGAEPVERPDPISRPPATETSYVDTDVTFDQERCYVVRAFDEVDSLQIRGPASRPTCTIPVDTFPPQPPVGLIAVGSRDAISLVWDASAEADIAGYLVLRAGAPGATLQPLTTEPIVETTFRDTDVEPDQRYVYAVQAVDDAVPQNVSEPSGEVLEQAR